VVLLLLVWQVWLIDDVSCLTWLSLVSQSALKHMGHVCTPRSANTGGLLDAASIQQLLQLLTQLLQRQWEHGAQKLTSERLSPWLLGHGAVDWRLVRTCSCCSC
jgi:hypothetical protein